MLAHAEAERLRRNPSLCGNVEEAVAESNAERQVAYRRRHLAVPTRRRRPVLRRAGRPGRGANYPASRRHHDWRGSGLA